MTPEEQAVEAKLKELDIPYERHDHEPIMTVPLFYLYKGSKTFSAMQIFIEEVAYSSFKFSITQGRMYQLHRVLRAVAKI